jgi:hypothetical protein
MTSSLPSAAQRVAAAAAAAGTAVEIHEMPASTRTAAEAAQACGCTVAQIVKSLVFRGVETGKPYLLFVSGANRVDEKAVAVIIGESLKRHGRDAVLQGHPRSRARHSRYDRQRRAKGCHPECLSAADRGANRPRRSVCRGVSTVRPTPPPAALAKRRTGLLREALAPRSAADIVKFLIDECLSPELVALARARGFHESTHVTWLGMRSRKNWAIVRRAIEEGFVLVTNDTVDFTALYA